MSDSRRKTPIVGNCADSEKKDKQNFSRSYRTLVRIILNKSWFDMLPARPNHRHGRNWNFRKDGKHWTKDKELLRK